MFEVIVGTNRRDARSSIVGGFLLTTYRSMGVEAGLIDLAVESKHLQLRPDHSYLSTDQGSELRDLVGRIDRSRALTIVCPEYNGSYPGVLKYFIDHWAYPLSFEFRPVAFVGLGGRFGGLRPVEHLQGVFGYRNSFIYPERVFLFNVWDQLKDGRLPEDTQKLLTSQAQGFVQFVKALEAFHLSAITRSFGRPTA